MPRATPDLRAHRRREVARLYGEGLGLEATAAEIERLGLGRVSMQTIRFDLKTLSIPTRRPGQPRKHPTPVERTCELPGCETRFTPLPGNPGRYCSRAHTNEAHARYPRPRAKRCRECGETFTPPRNKPDQESCSASCANRHKSKYPSPEPRQCRTCGEEFTPKHPSAAVEGTGAYCSRTCADTSEQRRQRIAAAMTTAWADEAEAARKREAMRRGHAKKRARIADYARANGYINRAGALALLGLSGHTLPCVPDLIYDGLELFSEDTVKRLGRARVTSNDRRIQLRFDPNYVLRHTLKIGAPVERAEELAIRAEQTARRLRRIRTGLAPGAVRHGRWLSLYERLLREYADGEGVDLFAAVAELDWAEHPDDWLRDRYPASQKWSDSLDPRWRHAARERVRRALAQKRCISPK